jgi:SAM-dependent methyltransferase
MRHWNKPLILELFMSTSSHDQIRQKVRDTYGQVARSGSPEAMFPGEKAKKTEEPGNSGCCAPSCCAPEADTDVEVVSRRLGYAAEDLAGMPQGANMGLGCGNPQAIANLASGELVLDLGSGGGFDAFLAARQVGENGRVIGVDMTPDMISLARRNAEKLGLFQAEFRLGEIENLPVADGQVDVILSNCVINLSPDKGRVFNEAFRVLKNGGRLAISDVVATGEIPEAMRADPEMLAGCVGGAAPVAEIESLLKAAGFVDIQVVVKDESREFIADWAPGSGVEKLVASANIEAKKP